MTAASSTATTMATTAGAHWIGFPTKRARSSGMANIGKTPARK